MALHEPLTPAAAAYLTHVIYWMRRAGNHQAAARLQKLVNSNASLERIINALPRTEPSLKKVVFEGERLIRILGRILEGEARERCRRQAVRVGDQLGFSRANGRLAWTAFSRALANWMVVALWREVRTDLLKQGQSRLKDLEGGYREEVNKLAQQLVNSIVGPRLTDGPPASK